MFEPPPSKRNTEVLWPVGLTATHMFAVVCKPTDPRPQVGGCACVLWGLVVVVVSGFGGGVMA